MILYIGDRVNIAERGIWQVVDVTTDAQYLLKPVNQRTGHLKAGPTLEIPAHLFRDTEVTRRPSSRH